MKKLLLLVAIMLCCAMSIFAQNNKISYQAVVRNSENQLVANKSVDVTVEIFNGTETTAAYTETHTNVQTNYNGLFSLQIGGGTATGVSWDEAVINWKDAKVITAVSLGGTQLATLEMPLTAVPYALYADYAEEINPDAVVVTEIYEKMLADSNALAGQITNLDSKLTDKIHGDSLALAGQINTVNTNLTNKIHQDSVALADKMRADSLLLHTALIDSIGDVREALKDSVGNINTRMENMANALHSEITTLDNKLTNRINVISDSVKTNYENIALNRQAIIDSTAHIRTEIDTTSKAIRNTLTSTASAIRSEVDTKLQSYAQLNGNNTFSGNNTFTGTVTAGTITASSVTVTCGENVTADVCDLLQRINTLEQKINDPQTLLTLVEGMTEAQKDQLKRALGVYVADSVSLNKSTTIITTGGSEVLVAKVWPDTIAQDVQWTSSNEQVARVVDGVVHAIAPGQAVIKATSLSTPSHFATCTVTVSNPVSGNLFNLKRNDDGTWEVTMPTNDLEVEIEVYNE